MTNATKDPTTELYGTLRAAFDYLNGCLFDNSLPHCLITVRQSKGALGYFAPDRFRPMGDRKPVHELALDSGRFNKRSPLQSLSTLAHEMCHVYQQVHGKPGKGGYHNVQFAQMMADVGLVCSATGHPGGAKVGRSMSHYIQSGGLFDLVGRFWIEQGHFDLPYFDRGKRSEPHRNKVKFSCNRCDDNAWGKPSLVMTCGCGGKFKEA